MFLTILLAMVIAFENTEWRGQIYEIAMVMLALYGYLNGYVTARWLKFYGATDWNFSAIVSSCALPVYFIGAIITEVFFSYILHTP